MRLLAWGLLAALLLPIPASASPWPRAVGHSDEGCTVVAVRPKLLITASHCVSRPGWEQTAYYYRGARSVPVTALVVWDGAFSERYADLALLVPETPWPTTLPLARFTPPPDTPAIVYGYLLGATQQAVRVQVGGFAEVAGHGWMLSIFGPIGPGNSGGPVVVRGEIVGIVVAVYLPLLRGIAVPAGTVASAIRDLDWRGPQQNRPGWND